MDSHYGQVNSERMDIDESARSSNITPPVVAPTNHRSDPTPLNETNINTSLTSEHYERHPIRRPERPYGYDSPPPMPYRYEDVYGRYHPGYLPDSPRNRRPYDVHSPTDSQE